MSTLITINVAVDTQTLRTDFPQGGNITNHSIIVMTDSNNNPVYETTNQDKLITSAHENNDLKWTIESSTERITLYFDAFSGDANTSKGLVATPAKNPANESEILGKCKNNLKEDVDIDYQLAFYVSDNPGVIWTWDPRLIIKR